MIHINCTEKEWIEQVAKSKKSDKILVEKVVVPYSFVCQPHKLRFTRK